jgi:hypothetical protein
MRGLRRLTRRRPWTADEDDFLAANYGAMSDEQLAERVSRTSAAVQARRLSLGILRRKSARRDYSNLRWWDNGLLRQLGKASDVEPITIRKHVLYLDGLMEAQKQ